MSTLPKRESWPVMVLAHNEERHIKACLDSIFAADPERAFEVYVMANGCTDNTEQVVRQYGQGRRDVHVVSIQLPDKCNAWNVFVHETIPARCPGRGIYFFMDGDARAVRGSFSVMAQALVANPYAHAASAPPASGRNAARDRPAFLQARGLLANLYAVRGQFVKRLQQEGVRIPVGLEGDDGLLGALIKWDLAPSNRRFDDERIVPCPNAGFEFEPMSPFRLADWKIYWKRAIRYGRRKYEFQLIGPRLKAQGISALPADIRQLYADAASLRLEWQGIYTLTNLIALRRMRKFAQHRSAFL